MILKKYNPHEGQVAFHYGIERLYRFLAMICGIRGGKCLSVDQGVLLSDGSSKRAGDIRAGDEVLGFDLDGRCKPTKVISTEMTKKQTAMYLLSDGSSFICSTDHAFPCWNAKRKKFEERPIQDIAERNDNYIYLLGAKDVSFSNKKSLVIHPYLLGLILGDGCISQNFVGISTADKEILEACKEYSGLEVKHRSKYDYGLVSTVRDSKGYNSNWIVTALREMGLMGTNSKTKFIPSEYLSASRQDRIDLLSGIVDTDGHVDDRGHIEVITASKRLADGILFLLRSLGQRASISEKYIKYNGESKIYYRLHWKNKDQLSLRLFRKSQKLKDRKKQCSDRVYVKDFVSLGLNDCIDISVECSSHLFLLDNFIATHNTYAGAREAARQAWNYKGDKQAVYGIIAPTYNMLDRTTWREFKIAASPLIAKENSSKKIITLKNGREVYGFSAEHHDRIRNVTMMGYWVDEARECKAFADLWDVLLGRVLSTGGKGIVTTSPNSFDDIHEIFIENKKNGYGTVRFSTFENTTIPHEAIKSLEENYDSKFAQQELYGEIVVFEGAVYYTFNRKHNAGDLAFKVAQYNPNKPIELCVDFNVDPMAWVLTQKGIHAHSNLPEVRVFDEIFLRNTNTVQMCQEFKDRYPDHQNGLILYGDATGRARHTSSNVTNWKIIQNELAEYNPIMRVGKSNPAERDRVNAVNGMICNSRGHRRVLVNPNCKHIIRDLEQVSYKEGSVQIDKTKDLKLTHPSDALGYRIEKEFSLNKGKIEGLALKGA